MRAPALLFLVLYQRQLLGVFGASVHLLPPAAPSADLTLAHGPRASEPAPSACELVRAPLLPAEFSNLDRFASMRCPATDVTTSSLFRKLSPRRHVPRVVA